MRSRHLLFVINDLFLNMQLNLINIKIAYICRYSEYRAGNNINKLLLVNNLWDFDTINPDWKQFLCARVSNIY
jgi:hypothetical protein